jgi:hypothetical protein
MDSPVQMCGLFTTYPSSNPSKTPKKPNKTKKDIEKGNLEELNDIFGVN